jgi:hypothetical protein
VGVQFATRSLDCSVPQPSQPKSPQTMSGIPCGRLLTSAARRGASVFKMSDVSQHVRGSPTCSTTTPVAGFLG